MKNFFDGVKIFLTNKEKRTVFLSQHGFFHKMSDEEFIKMQYKNVFGYDIDLNNPVTYNEKLQWLKLYDRKPIYTKMVDKYEAKNVISEIIGEEYIIPTLGIYDNFSEINFDKLPKQFVIKCTHDSGGIVICKDKSKLDLDKAKRKIEKSLKNNYYWQNREWPYKEVKPRIIIEKYMVDESGYELKDYKFFCFDGKMKAMFIATDRSSTKEETKFDFFDENFVHLPFTNGHPNSNKVISKPKSFEKMIMLAEKISKGIPQVRVDFYDINGKIYFGEVTFFHWSGLKKFEPNEWDKKFGDWIKLPIEEERK